jgi:hypothetical protein
MRAEVYRPNDEGTVVGEAVWDGRAVRIETEDDSVRTSLARIFRLTPVVVADTSLRPLYAGGEVVVNPGSLEWFREAALTRADREGLRVRLVPEAQGRGGWDPASAYRTFRQAATRLVTERAGSDVTDR